MVSSKVRKRSRWFSQSDSNPGYDSAFFGSIRTGSRSSASVVVPLLIEAAGPASVIDIGCAEGSFLAAFRASGIDDVVGVDGDYVDRASLEIPAACFVPADLNDRVGMDRVFDLALSLEVAEHLLPSRAETFVEDLVRLAPIVAFSAAIPGQGGTGHVNERWQDDWASIFARHDYRPVDVLRRAIWMDDRVEPWYAQNLVVYARADKLDGPAPDPLRVVHPRVLGYLVREYTRPVNRHDVVRLLRRAVHERLRA